MSPCLPNSKLKTHNSLLLTGTRSWESLTPLLELIEAGEQFAAVTPVFRPVFVNLSETPAAELEQGGFFGWVLRLVQQRRARPEEFRALLEQAVQHLEQLPAAARVRWRELLSYIHALVYHERSTSEHQDLHERIRESVATDESKREVTGMVRSMADVLKAEGRKMGRKEGHRKGLQEGLQKGLQEGEVQALQRALITLLQERFTQVPPDIQAIIRQTQDVALLGEWLKRVVTAATLADMGISGR